MKYEKVSVHRVHKYLCIWQMHHVDRCGVWVMCVYCGCEKCMCKSKRKPATEPLRIELNVLGLSTHDARWESLFFPLLLVFLVVLFIALDCTFHYTLHLFPAATIAVPLWCMYFYWKFRCCWLLFSQARGRCAFIRLCVALYIGMQFCIYIHMLRRLAEKDTHVIYYF